MRRRIAIGAAALAAGGVLTLAAPGIATAAIGDTQVRDGRTFVSQGDLRCIEPTIFAGDNHLGTGKDWYLTRVNQVFCRGNQATYEFWLER